MRVSMDYKKERKHPLQLILFILLFALLYSLTYTDILSINIYNAAPMPLIAFIITVGFYYGEWAGFISGVIAGVFVDAVTPHSICFNTIFLLLIGAVTGALIRRILNQNIFSALMLSAIANAVYFAAEFIFCIKTFPGETVSYLLFYALPSAVYSAVFILPCYYLGLLIKKI